tara:strand:- start:50 stop:238 length:189 start_codon:yes stop_codon:yes gene_type:complete
MSKEKQHYTIKKTIIEKNIQVILNDSMGVVAYFTFDEAIKMCQLLNSNSDSNCRYEITQEIK